ncbi:MAG: hypothetical protein EZS28_041676, partial [Streblomastix strix]
MEQVRIVETITTVTTETVQSGEVQQFSDESLKNRKQIQKLLHSAQPQEKKYNETNYQYTNTTSSPSITKNKVNKNKTTPIHKKKNITASAESINTPPSSKKKQSLNNTHQIPSTEIHRLSNTKNDPKTNPKKVTKSSTEVQKQSSDKKNRAMKTPDKKNVNKTPDKPQTDKKIEKSPNGEKATAVQDHKLSDSEKDKKPTHKRTSSGYGQQTRYAPLRSPQSSQSIRIRTSNPYDSPLMQSGRMYQTSHKTLAQPRQMISTHDELSVQRTDYPLDVYLQKKRLEDHARVLRENNRWMRHLENKRKRRHDKRIRILMGQGDGVHDMRITQTRSPGQLGWQDIRSTLNRNLKQREKEDGQDSDDSDSDSDNSSDEQSRSLPNPKYIQYAQNDLNLDGDQVIQDQDGDDDYDD